MDNRRGLVGEGREEYKGNGKGEGHAKEREKEKIMQGERRGKCKGKWK